MNDENFDEISKNPEKKRNKNRVPANEPLDNKKIDLQAAHRKAVMVMIGIFLAILALMVLLQNHVEFASTGGM